MKKIDFNALRDRAYKCACDHGFHDKEYSIEHLLMLVITEISEAVEAERKGKHAQRKMFERENITPQPYPDKHFMYVFDMFVKDSVEDELADTVIRLLDLAGLCSVDLRHVCGLCDTIKDDMNYDFMSLCFMWCRYCN